jgi:hypothetical protein
VVDDEGLDRSLRLKIEYGLVNPGRAAGDERAVHSRHVSVAAAFNAVGLEDDAEQAVSVAESRAEPVRGFSEDSFD